jgi:hypothetical protein
MPGSLPYSAKRIHSTACVKGLNCATRYTHSAPDSSSFHNGYRAVDMKYIGKMTKFIVPAKFSSCLMCTLSSRPSEPSISAAHTADSSTIGVCGPNTGSTVPSSAATTTNAAACASDSTAVAVSLDSRIHARGSGAVSSSRIKPISRS